MLRESQTAIASRPPDATMAKTIEEGDKAPDFTLETDGGGKTSLKDFAGNPLVLYFYPKDDTSGCTKEAIDFSAVGAKFKKLGVPITPSVRPRSLIHFNPSIMD